MTSNKKQFEISESLVNDLFTKLGLEIPEKINDDELTRLLTKLQEKTNLDLAKTEKKHRKTKGGVRSVLVVDDLCLVVYQLSLLLTKRGFDVALARSTHEALTVFEGADYFDVVLMDLFMPDKEDGIELLTKIKCLIQENDMDTKIVVMSSTKDLHVIEEVIKLGANYFIEKGQDWQKDIIQTFSKIQFN